MTDALPRAVVREHRFEQEAQAIQPSVRRMDEALEFAEWQIARHPDSGIQSSVPGIWVAPVRVPDEEGNVVRASIFYTFENGRVCFQSIRLAP